MTWRRSVYGGAVGYVVAGPMGALVGATLAGGEEGGGMRGVPTGVHVEAKWTDDEVGRRWTLEFLSALPPRPHAQVRLVSDAGLRLLGRPPFRDGEGHFLAAAPIIRGSATLYTPFGSMEYSSPKHISLEVTVCAPQPVGKGTLEAKLPAPRPFSAADYLRPLLSLGGQLLEVDANAEGDALGKMVAHIGQAFELSSGPLAPAEQDAMSRHGRAPLAVEEAVKKLLFRFPGVPASAHLDLLRAACLGESEPNKAQAKLLQELATRLAGEDPGSAPRALPRPPSR